MKYRQGIVVLEGVVANALLAVLAVTSIAAMVQLERQHRRAANRLVAEQIVVNTLDEVLAAIGDRRLLEKTVLRLEKPSDEEPFTVRITYGADEVHGGLRIEVATSWIDLATGERRTTSLVGWSSDRQEEAAE